MSRERTPGGEYTEEYTTEAILEQFREVPVPLLTAPEVAEALGCSDPTARDRLDTLAEDGQLYRKTVGARAVVYAMLEDPHGRRSGYGPWKRSLWTGE